MTTDSGTTMFIEIVSRTGSLEAAGWGARGLYAYVTGNSWTLHVGKRELGGIELADKIIQFDEICNEISGSWQEFYKGKTISLSDFLDRLESGVRKLENWIPDGYTMFED